MIALKLKNVIKLKKEIDKLPKHLKNKNFISFNITNRAMKVFKRENVRIPQDLYSIPNEEIYHLKGLGNGSIQSVTASIAKYNLLRNDNRKIFLTKKKELQLSSKIDKITLSIVSNMDDAMDWLDMKSNSVRDHQFTELNLKDDLDYILNRHKLSEDTRRDIDIYRFNLFLEEADCGNPLSILANLPEWILKTDIKELELSAFNEKLVSHNNISNIADFFRFNQKELKALSNEKSLMDLSNSIISLYNKKNLEESNRSRDLITSFFATLRSVPKKSHRNVMRLRLGFYGKIETLGRVSEIIGLTNERIRQIQKNITIKAIANNSWCGILKVRLEKLLKESDKPVYVDELGRIDPWFKGFEDKPLLLKQIIVQFSSMRIFFINSDDRSVLSEMQQEEWDSTVKRILKYLKDNVFRRYTLQDVRIIIKSELEELEVPCLSDLLYEQIENRLNFSLIDNERILTSLGKTVTSYLITLLEEQPEPMHFNEIRRIYEEKYKIRTSERSIHSRLSADGFLLFSRGTYGTDKHVLISKSKRKTILKKAENFIFSNPGRQWHSDEILHNINEDDIDKYILNIILHTSRKISYLGKMLWLKKGKEQDRLHIKDVVVEVLCANGKPMHIKEIQREVQKIRSLGVDLSITLQPNELYTRTAIGTWGLVERDFIFSSQEWQEIKDYLSQYFQKSQNVLDTCDLLEHIPEKYKSQGLTNEKIAGILVIDDKFKRWHGRIVGLSAWDDRGY